MDLHGKVAIITGASSGIGKATAIALSRSGVKVVLAARREDRLKEVQNKLQNESLIVVTDVSKKKYVDDLVSQTVKKYGTVDILVNNAGVMLSSFFEKCKVEEWERMIDVNIKGVLYGMAFVTPIMKENKNGHIINIASIAGHRVIPSSAIYSATKFAIRAISEGYRQELTTKYNIRISIISPGLVDTELTNHITDSDVIEMISKKEIKAIRPDTIAENIVHLLSQPMHVNLNEIIVMPTMQN